MTRIDGKCLCGAVTVSIVPANTSLHACHCDMCRAWAGSTFMAVEAKKDSLKVDGPVKVFSSSDWAERAWCDTCGSSLWYKLTVPGHENYGLNSGLFPDAGGTVLDLEYYIDKKPAGYDFAGEHARLTRAEVEVMFASIGEGDPE